MSSPLARASLSPFESSLRAPVDEVAAQLESFASLLWKWQRVQNLVSRETDEGELWQRHIADSLQVLHLLRDDDREYLDLGSGGGFPAVPLAIAGAGRFLLVEPNTRKASFLRLVARELSLPITVRSERAEQLDPTRLPAFDVITARAVTSLVRLCALAAPFFGPKTRAIFHKGREHVDELVESRAVWHHDVVVTKSVTDPTGVLLELTGLRRKSTG